MTKTASDEAFEKWCQYLVVAPEADLPEVAYHYTNSAGLMGILDKKCVYASDKHFLNDRTEIRHGIDAAIKGLKNQISKSRTEQNTDLLNLACDYMDQEKDERYFIFSMSERSDDLSQWRGYANDGDGFSVGFDISYLRKMSSPKNAPFGFNRVSYSPMQFRALIGRLSSEFSIASASDSDDDNSARCLSSTIEVAACFHKHTSFRYEREWRLVSFVYPKGAEEILIRNSNGHLVPYIELPLCNSGEPLPIVEIGIGPAVQNPNTRIVIGDLCSRAGISPKIYNAATPFVRY